MPAVNPTRLRFQVEELIAFFESPPEFHRQLRDLFDLYANRALRFGEFSPPRPLIPMYHLPQAVTRQLELDLKPHIIKNPQATLALVDELWDDPYFEVQKLAIFLLGNIPINVPDPVYTRVKNWLNPQLDKSIIAALLSTGIFKLQNAFPKAWASLIETFLTQDNPKMVAIGIQGLTEGIKNPSFKNLPVIFRLTSPLLREPHHATLKELQALIETLAQQFPTETAYFLKQTLSISESSKTERLVKSSLTKFPEIIRQDLIATIKK